MCVSFFTLNSRHVFYKFLLHVLCIFFFFQQRLYNFFLLHHVCTLLSLCKLIRVSLFLSDSISVYISLFLLHHLCIPISLWHNLSILSSFYNINWACFFTSDISSLLALCLCNFNCVRFSFSVTYFFLTHYLSILLYSITSSVYDSFFLRIHVCSFQEWQRKLRLHLWQWP